MTAKAVTTLPSGLPQHTLGWAVLAWCSRYIRQPDGPRAGEQFQFTPEQVRFILWFYGIDSSGRWLYSRGVLRRAKGWGKSPVVAALCLAELCGPVRFGGWHDDGTPIAVEESAPWVQIAGVSKQQTVNTMSLVLAMVAESSIIEDYGLDVGLTRIFTAAGGRLEPITASAPTAEGARPTFVAEDETHHWLENNGGLEMDRVNRRNVGKIAGGIGRVLETTNAHAPGQESVAERSYEAWKIGQEGKLRRVSLLYDSREAPADLDLSDEEQAREYLKLAYGDSTWPDIDRLMSEIYDPSTPPEDSLRFYFNMIYAASDAWLAQPEWEARADAAHVVPNGAAITLGFDGALRSDATAVVGCEVATGHLFLLACFEQPTGPGSDQYVVPREAVDAVVASAFEEYRVAAFYADPPFWGDYIDKWTAEFAGQLTVKAKGGGGPIEWWTQRAHQMVAALERFHTAVTMPGGEFSHDGDSTLTRHVLNARRRVGRAGITIAKEHPHSERKIDACVAAVLAYEARQDVVAAGGVQPTRSRKLIAF